MHYTLFMPWPQNDGNQQPPELVEWLEGELVKQAGGLTRYYPGHGIWVPLMSSAICQDVVDPFHIVTTNDRETEVWLIALVAEIARIFEQEEIFVFSQRVWLL